MNTVRFKQVYVDFWKTAVTYCYQTEHNIFVTFVQKTFSNSV